jgi:hypothetical protein
MLPLAGIFGINNSAISLAITLVLFFLAVIWLALVYWTYADARRRIDDGLVIVCAAIASFIFPFVGTIVYMIVRPPEFLDDVRERELEMQAAEARLAELGYHLCPHCDHEVEKEFLRCPHCMRKLKDPCHNCGKPLDPGWRVCPYCEAEIGALTTGPRRARRRREAADQPVGPATAFPAERSGGSGYSTERSATSGYSSERSGSSAFPSERGGSPAPVERGGTPAT